MLLAEVVPKWASEATFIQGFALVQALPGPMFNFSAFLGGVARGPMGALVAWASLFGPGLLLIIAALPYWAEVQGSARAKAVLRGVNAVACGLVVAAISHEQPTSAAEREAIKKAVGKNGQKVIYFRSKQGSGLKNSWTNETSASTKGYLRFTTEAPIEAVQALQEALRKCPEVTLLPSFPTTVCCRTSPPPHTVLPCAL